MDDRRQDGRRFGIFVSNNNHTAQASNGSPIVDVRSMIFKANVFYVIIHVYNFSAFI